MRAKKICSNPACFNLQPCEDHTRKAWVKTGEEPRRLRGRKAVARRRHILERDQFTCYLCGQTKLEDDLVADHVEPLAEGGADTTSNLKCCCTECHDEKSAREAQHGQTPGG